MKALKRYKTFVSILCIQILLIGQVSGIEDSRPLLPDAEQSYYYEAQELEKLGVFKGTNQGFELSRQPSRLEALIMMMRMLGLEEDVLVREDSTSYFVDVPTWGFEYVNLAYERGLTQGVDENLFGMERQVDAKMFVTFMLRALNYDDKKGDFQYQEAVEFALDIGMIDEEFREELEQETFTRNFVAKIVFNTLNASLANDERTLSRYLIDSGKLAQAEQTKGPVETPTSDKNIDEDIDDEIDEMIEDIVEDSIYVHYNTPIVGEPRVDAEVVKDWARSKGMSDEGIDMVDLYYEIAGNKGLDPVIQYIMMVHETGWLYKNKTSQAGLDASYFNPCGLKISEGGGDYDANAHARFSSWKEGIEAHTDHSALYAGLPGYPKANTPDPRHFTWLEGIGPTIYLMAKSWSTDAYADRIISYYNDLIDLGEK